MAGFLDELRSGFASEKDKDFLRERFEDKLASVCKELSRFAIDTIKKEALEKAKKGELQFSGNGRKSINGILPTRYTCYISVKDKLLTKNVFYLYMPSVKTNVDGEEFITLFLEMRKNGLIKESSFSQYGEKHYECNGVSLVLWEEYGKSWVDFEIHNWIYSYTETEVIQYDTTTWWGGSKKKSTEREVSMRGVIRSAYAKLYLNELRTLAETEGIKIKETNCTTNEEEPKLLEVAPVGKIPWPGGFFLKYEIFF